MVKLEYLSPNIIAILKQMILNDDLAKLLYYKEKNPLEMATITDKQSALLFHHIFPYPFDPRVATTATSQIRVYYPSGSMKNRAVEDTKVSFDIIVAKELWLTNNFGEASVRPYMIMKEIVNDFDDRSIDTVGRLNFKSFRHIILNETFDAINLVADMTTFGRGI